MSPLVTPDIDTRLLDKLDDLSDKIGSLNSILTKHDVTMTTLVDRIQDLEVDIIPIKKHYLMVEGTVKLIGVLALIAGIALSWFTIFHT